jgi:hypothetical protein
LQRPALAIYRIALPVWIITQEYRPGSGSAVRAAASIDPPRVTYQVDEKGTAIDLNQGHFRGFGR